jgi:hypothetical protein
MNSLPSFSFLLNPYLPLYNNGKVRCRYTRYYAPRFKGRVPMDIGRRMGKKNKKGR